RVEMCRDVSIGFTFTEREIEVTFDALRAGLAEEARRVISRLEGLRPTRVRVRLPPRAKLDGGEAGGALVARRTGEALDLGPVVAAAEKVGAAFEVAAAPAAFEKASPARPRRRR
ncbi:MAG TPA: hypothetical protein VL400_10215, partial [Polyangiaceae bacterium]|nr:hypothetical protein [Polyangiaceae bacterium]